MIRFNLWLDDKQLENLRTIANTRVSVSEHIRRAIDIYIEDNYGEIIQKHTIRLLKERTRNASDKPDPQEESYNK